MQQTCIGTIKTKKMHDWVFGRGENADTNTVTSNIRKMQLSFSDIRIHAVIKCYYYPLYAYEVMSVYGSLSKSIYNIK
jgi:hypothetical protein